MVRDKVLQRFRSARLRHLVLTQDLGRCGLRYGVDECLAIAIDGLSLYSREQVSEKDFR